MDESEGFKTSMEIVIVSVVEIARESELKAQNKDETELW
jgi:hypothetical protein